MPIHTRSTAVLLPLLCIVIAAVLLASMPIYRTIEESYSADHGLGAAMTELRNTLEENETVAALLGLQADAPVVAVSSEPEFDLAAAVAAYIDAHTPNAVLPLDGIITSPYGRRSDPFRTLSTAKTEDHIGVDLASMTNVTIVAAKSGEVVTVAADPSYGNYLILDHGDCRTLYAHCAEIAVVPGQRVTVGEEIATAGKTGRATGIHLHFEVIVDGARVDPLAYLGLSAPAGA